VLSQTRKPGLSTRGYRRLERVIKQNSRDNVHGNGKKRQVVFQRKRQQKFLGKLGHEHRTNKGKGGGGLVVIIRNKEEGRSIMHRSCSSKKDGGKRSGYS